MKRVDYFATPVFQFDLVTDNKRLLDWAYQANTQDINLHGGRQSFNTADKKNNAKMEHVFPLSLQYLKNDIQTCIDKVAIDLDFPKCDLQNYWLNINPFGGSNDAHNHPNSLLVANYYVNVPAKDTPYTGLLVVFPGWVKHSVTTNLNKEHDRVSLSMNYGKIRP
jgi:uncharacterized protein (TIGR02466 family)